MVASLHELRGREAKAKVIADWIRTNRPEIDADLAGYIDHRGRQLIARAAGKTGVSDLTWEQVISRLRRPVYVPPVLTDAFDGIEGH